MTTVVHCKQDSYDVYIGRPSKWGNQFSHLDKSCAKHSVTTRQDAVNLYRARLLNGDGQHLLDDLEELRHKRLGCWCKPKSCHDDVLVELIKQRFPEDFKNIQTFQTVDQYIDEQLDKFL